jgi:hypothetical protein
VEFSTKRSWWKKWNFQPKEVGGRGGIFNQIQLVEVNHPSLMVELFHPKGVVCGPPTLVEFSTVNFSSAITVLLRGSINK